MEEYQQGNATLLIMFLFWWSCMLVSTLPSDTRFLVVTLHLSGVQDWTDTSEVSPVVSCTNDHSHCSGFWGWIEGCFKRKAMCQRLCRDLLSKLDIHLEFPDPVVWGCDLTITELATYFCCWRGNAWYWELGWGCTFCLCLASAVETQGIALPWLIPVFWRDFHSLPGWKVPPAPGLNSLSCSEKYFAEQTQQDRFVQGCFHLPVPLNACLAVIATTWWWLKGRIIRISCKHRVTILTAMWQQSFHFPA